VRVVIDTNVILSGIYDPDSIPGKILDAAVVGSLSLCSPESVKSELDRVLGRVLGFAPLQIRHAFEALRIDWIPKKVYEPEMSRARDLLRDPDDAPILACALAAGCDIVTGDKDLHAVRVRGIRVWKPSELDRENHA